ncbi:sodium channel protein Nach [Drosophila virilis]|uniref:Uncharacterized protein n=1 Tax=Drosophila virilis TaxID=7244 RepID=B4LWY4_DROVI|nr:sodium channel protein Nach [Drosophila virilis]EDW67731.2 uncharacterized protein Dvir_GJ24319 [Drosophila virilis]
MTTNAERASRLPSQRLVVGRAAWWIPKPRIHPPASVPQMAVIREEEPATRKLSFAAALKDLLQNLSFHCYGKLVEHGRRIQERFFWLICHITALTVLIAFVWGTYKDATDELVTTLYNPLYPVCQVALPAVTVCTQNRISKRAVWQYAQELSDKDPKQRNASYFYGELHAFGMFYSPEELGDYERVLRFQGLLDSIDTTPYELFFNTSKRMRILTPNCSDIFVSCRLAGRSFDCLQEFRETLSIYGFCCTFNSDGEFLKDRTYHQRFYGYDMGLVLTLKSPKDDNFYKMHHLEGYPDPQSGGVAVRYVQTGRRTHLPVRPKIFETVPEARHMSPAVRKCLFWDETPHNFTNRYTFSKCISACRARSMYNLCECLPFQIPKHYIGDATGGVFCTLQHMECLRRYKFKWLNVITSRANVPGLEHELEDALYCPECLPSCTEIRYNVRGAGALALNSLHRPMTSSGSGMANNSYGHDSSELADVRIYFAETHIQYFRQIIKNDWYEIFSTIGNICGIIAGFSLIGICELLFFLAKQLWHAYKAELKSELCRTHAHAHSQSRARSRTRANGRATATQQQEQHRQHRQPMELLILP